MSEGGHHHGGDMGAPQGFQPGMFPAHEPHHHHQHGDMGGLQGFQPGMFPGQEPDRHHGADSPDLMPPAYGRRSRYGVRRYRPRPGSPAWVGLWVVRLAVLAFIIYVAFQVFHGATSSPSP
jgi:hypothetical protein